MSHDDLANDIMNYMNHYGIEKAYVLGHSLGGKAVMQFAISFPEKVEKLIVVDISPKAYPPHHQGIIKALETVDFNTVTSRNEVEAVLNQGGAHDEAHLRLVHARPQLQHHLGGDDVTLLDIHLVRLEGI